MLRSGAPNSNAFFLNLGYDPDRESAAFAALAVGDVRGCRREIHALLRDLRVPGNDLESRQLQQLLSDLLQRLNRRVHYGPAARERRRENRAELIGSFSRCIDPADALRAFRRALRSLLDPERPLNGSANRLALNAKTHIEANYERRTSLSTVAAHLHVSSNYLSRVFRRETGQTLTSFIQQIRIDHARQLLAEGNHSISEIAYRVGYRNYRDFYRNFVRQENASPREVRERLSRAG